MKLRTGMKINVSNSEAIIAAIKKAQGKATSFTLSESNVQQAVRDAENKLSNLGIPKKLWKRCYIRMIPELPANAYKYRPSGTYITISKGATAWFVTEISRCQTGTTSGGRRRMDVLYLTEEAHTAIPGKYLV